MTKRNIHSDELAVETTDNELYRRNPDGTYTQITAGGATFVTTEANLGEADVRTAFAAAGAGAGVVPNSDLSSVPAAADIIAWSFTAGKKHAVIQVGVDKVAGNTYLGWWVTINAGSTTAALTRLQEALGIAAGAGVAVYAAGDTVDANENKASYVVTDAGFEITTGLDGDDITDMYVMPVTSNATAVGTTILTAIVS